MTRTGESAKAALVEILGSAIGYVWVDDDGLGLRAEIDHDHLESITFANLQRVSEAFGTKNINLTGESARWYSEQTGGDPATLELVIQDIKVTP